MCTRFLLPVGRLFFLVVLLIDGFAAAATAQQRIAIVPVGPLPDSVDVNPVTDRVYVANPGDNTITVINATSHAVIATIAVPRVGQLAVNPVTNRIYSAGLASGMLSVIDGISNTVTTVPAPLSECPCGVAINSVTDRVYVTRPRTGDLLVYSGATNGLVATVNIGLDPHHLIVNEAANKIYVLQNSGFTGAGVVVVDGASNTTLKTIVVMAEDLALDRQTGFVYAVNEFPRFLHVIDGSVDSLVQSIPLTDFFGNVAVNARTGRLYLNGGDDLAIFDVATRSRVASITGLLNPAGARFTKTLASHERLAKVFKVNRGATLTEAGANTVEVIQDIGSLNEAPSASPSSLTTSEDVVAAGTLSGTDPEGGALTFTIVANGSRGTVVLTNPTTGAFTYTPNPDANGSDTFTFKVSDGEADSNVAAVSVAIAAVNDPPVARDDAAGTAEDVPVSGNALANDSDVDSGSLTARLQSAPTHGSVAFNADGSFFYTPAPNFNGDDSFSYVANDGEADSNTATVRVTVAPVNDPPLARHAFYQTMRNTAVAGVLIGSDVDSDALTFTAVALPSQGTLTLDPQTGAFTYKPNKNVTGLDVFGFRVTDGVEQSSIAWVVIAINK